MDKKYDWKIINILGHNTNHHAPIDYLPIGCKNRWILSHLRMNTFFQVAPLCQNGKQTWPCGISGKISPSARLFSSGSPGRRLCSFQNASVSPGCSPTCPFTMLANLDMVTVIHPGTRLSVLISVPAGRHGSHLVESLQKRPGGVPCSGVWE